MKKRYFIMKMKKIFRYPLSTVYLIVGLIIAFLMLFDGLTIYNQVTNDTKENQKMQYLETTEVMIDNLDNVEMDFNVLKSKEKVNINMVSEGYVDGVEGNVRLDVVIQEKVKPRIAMEQGRMPSAEEIEEGKPVLAIRSNLQEYIVHKDGKDYINLSGAEYEVVGIIRNMDSNAHIMVYGECLDSKMAQHILEMNSFDLVMNSEFENTYDAYKEIKENLIRKSPAVEIAAYKRDNNVDALSYAMNNTEASVVFFIYLFSLANCVIISEFWIEQRRVEVAIKKAFGFSNLKIVVDIFKEMLINCVFAGTACYIVQLVISKIVGYASGYVIKADIKEILLMGVFTIITTIIIILFPVWQIIRIAPAQAITSGRR